MKSLYGGSRGPTAWGGEAGAFAPSRESINGDSQRPSLSISFIIHNSSFIIHNSFAPLAAGSKKKQNETIEIKIRNKQKKQKPF
jgi:hypothetical protein